jgi:hypothetical protein
MDNERILLQRHSISQVIVYDVTKDELERIESKAADLGLDFQLSLAGITSAISILATLIFSPSQESLSRTIFWVMVPVLFLVGFIFAVRWYFSKGELSKIFLRIRARQVGPLGDEKREFRRPELEALPLEQAPLPAPGMTDSLSVAVAVAPALNGSEQK